MLFPLIVINIIFDISFALLVLNYLSKKLVNKPGVKTDKKKESPITSSSNIPSLFKLLLVKL